jgi:hypothetical protein
MELGIKDSGPALVALGFREADAPAVANQLQERFWRGAETGEEQMGGLKWPAITGAGGRHLHDPAGANSGLGDVLRCLLGPQHPGDFPSLADFVICCHKRDLALSKELAADLAVQRSLVGLLLWRSLRLDGQEEVGPLFLELPKNGFWVWRATPAEKVAPTAWIRTPS